MTPTEMAALLRWLVAMPEASVDKFREAAETIGVVARALLAGAEALEERAKLRERNAALEAALVASATCSACRGTGTIWPECLLCNGVDYRADLCDHPQSTPCAKCEGTGKHVLARDALSGGTAALDAAKAQARAEGYRAGQGVMRERAAAEYECQPPHALLAPWDGGDGMIRTCGRCARAAAIRALAIEEPKP